MRVRQQTVWLLLGTVAEMKGIGAETARFEISTVDWGRVIPYVSGQKADCYQSLSREQFEWTEFSHMHPYRKSESIWNLTLSVLSLSFEGRLVAENSTKITSFGDDAVPVFDAQYQRAPREEDVKISWPHGAAGGLMSHSLGAWMTSSLVALAVIDAVVGL